MRSMNHSLRRFLSRLIETATAPGHRPHGRDSGRAWTPYSKTAWRRPSSPARSRPPSCFRPVNSATPPVPPARRARRDRPARREPRVRQARRDRQAVRPVPPVPPGRPVPPARREQQVRPVPPGRRERQVRQVPREPREPPDRPGVSRIRLHFQSGRGSSPDRSGNRLRFERSAARHHPRAG